MKKYVVLFAIIFLVATNALAQDNPLLTQQWFSRINHNPASAGSNEDVDIFLVHRNQWAGFKHAPKTTLMNVHSSIDQFNSGLGLSLGYDTEGVARTNMIGKILYSYRLKLSWKSQLAFGLGASFQRRSLDYNKLSTVQPVDPELGTGKVTKSAIGFDFGVEFLTERITLGASVTNLGKKYDNLTTFKNGTQYYVYGHYMAPVSEDFSLSPTVTYVHGNDENLVEGGLTAFYRDICWVGAAYRYDSAICFFGGFRYNVFRLGYSYDSHIGDSKYLGNCSHEIVLSIRIPRSSNAPTRYPDGSVRYARDRIYRCR